jgi:CheY-like chemotaxis protein
MPHENRSMVRLIRASGETLAKILDDVLDFSKIECGKLEAHYDLVLMDIQMPGIDGQEASRRIRSQSATHSRIPIVALTASATVEDRGACVAAGMNDYLSKPLALDALRKVLEHWGPSHDAAGADREKPAGASSLAAIGGPC